jgi:hypothetical protein
MRQIILSIIIAITTIPLTTTGITISVAGMEARGMGQITIARTFRDGTVHTMATTTHSIVHGTIRIGHIMVTRAPSAITTEERTTMDGVATTITGIARIAHQAITTIIHPTILDILLTTVRTGTGTITDMEILS